MTCCRLPLTCLAPLASPRLMRALDCDPRDSFDPVEFIKNRGTLYLVARVIRGRWRRS